MTKLKLEAKEEMDCCSIKECTNNVHVDSTLSPKEVEEE